MLPQLPVTSRFGLPLVQSCSAAAAQPAPTLRPTRHSAPSIRCRRRLGLNDGGSLAHHTNHQCSDDCAPADARARCARAALRGPGEAARARALRAQAGGRSAAASLGFLAVLSAGPDSQPGVLHE